MSFNHLLYNKAISRKHNRRKCKSIITPKSHHTHSVAWLEMVENQISWKLFFSAHFFLMHCSFLWFIYENNLKLSLRKYVFTPNTILSCLYYNNIMCLQYWSTYFSIFSEYITIIIIPFVPVFTLQQLQLV